jgi:putative peptidoglycan lipid II flippase
VTDEPRASRQPGSLARSNVVTALGTGLSRVTGFGRVVALSMVLGRSQLTDTYNFANNTPNVVYELLLGGILTASLVPMFVQQFEEDDDTGTSAVVSVSMVAMLVLTVVAVMAAPAIIHLTTARVEHNAAQVRSVGTQLARLFFPQIFFYGLTALATALLNARRSFRAAAFAPVINNVVVIGVILALPHLVSRPLDLGRAVHSSLLVWTLGLGTTAGIVATALVLVWELRNQGIHLVWAPQFGHPAVKRLVRMSGWTIGYVAANQVAYLLVQTLAFQQAGWVTAYFYAFTFFVLPHGLLAVSLMTTFAPELATAAHRGEMDSFRSQVHLGLRALGLLVIPATVGYAVLAKSLVASTLQRREFGAADSLLTGRVLAAFAIGLFGFSAYLFILRAFYALKDAKTPFILNLGENAINIILAIALVHHFGVVGLAVSYAIAYNVSAVLAYVVLLVRVGDLPTSTLLVTLARYAVAATVMGVVIRQFANGKNFRLVAAGGVIGGAVIYGVVTLGLYPVEQAARRVIRRRGRPDRPDEPPHD